MGSKYMIEAFNYRKNRIGYDKQKQSKYLLSALFWFTILSIKYDGVDFKKRK